MNSIMEHINYADIIAASVVIFWTVLGLKKGLSGQIAFFMSGLIVTACIILGYTPCKSWLMQHYQMPLELARLITIVSIVTIPLLLILIIHSVAGEVVKVTFTAWVDRLGGALAGFSSSSAFVILVFVFLNVIPSEMRPAATGSDSLIGSRLIGIETSVAKTIGSKVASTRDVIQSARDVRTGRREKWEQ